MEQTSAARKLGFLKEDFRLFHLRDRQPGEYEPHYHDFHKILLFMEGNINYSIEGRTYSLAAGDMVLVEQGMIHRPVPLSSAPYERMILYLSPAFLEAFSTPESPLTQCFLNSRYRHCAVWRLKEESRLPLSSLLKKLETTLEEKDRFGSALLSRSLCLEFLVLLNRSCLDPVSATPAQGTLDYRISGLLSHINSHLTEELSIPALSRCCALSSYHMMRLFKEQTGYTIGAYITQKRLLLARDLLAQGKSATEACFQSGFQSYGSFLRAYKQRFQQLPKRKHTENQ